MQSKTMKIDMYVIEVLDGMYIGWDNDAELTLFREWEKAQLFREEGLAKDFIDTYRVEIKDPKLYVDWEDQKIVVKPVIRHISGDIIIV